MSSAIPTGDLLNLLLQRITDTLVLVVFTVWEYTFGQLGVLYWLLREQYSISLSQAAIFVQLADVWDWTRVLLKYVVAWIFIFRGLNFLRRHRKWNPF